MKTFLAALCFTVPLAIGGAGNAQDTIPNLVGTWEETTVVGLTWRGDPVVPHKDFRATIEITMQDGPVFSGVFRWQLAEGESQLHDGEKETSGAEESIMGVLDLDGETFSVVEHPDTTFRRMRLNDDGTLEVISFEGGPHAVVGRSTYARQ